MKPLIFISHSAKDREVAEVDTYDPQAVRRRETLIYTRLVRGKILAALNAIRDVAGRPRFDIWLDADVLAGGDDWDDRIEDGLHACHAAVILLDLVSVEAPWVLHEAASLKRRARTDDRLVVLPVFLGAFQSTHAYAMWEPTRLDRLVPIRLAGSEMSEDSAERLAMLVAARLRSVSREDDDSPMGLWVHDIATLIKNVGDDDRRRAALRLDPPLELSGRSSGSVTLADRLLRCPLAGAAGPLVELLRALDRDAGVRLITRIVPIWVNPDAGRELVASLAPDTAQLVILNLRFVDSAQEYLRRACFGRVEGRWEIVIVEQTTGAAAAEVVRDVEAKLRERNWGDDPLPDDPALSGVLVLLGRNAARIDIAQALHEKYRQVRFIVLSGSDYIDACAQLQAARLIQPTATADDETDARSIHRMLTKVTCS